MQSKGAEVIHWATIAARAKLLNVRYRKMHKELPYQLPGWAHWVFKYMNDLLKEAGCGQ